MSDVPLALAAAAGMLAALNPCGFALLPAYLSLVLADAPGRSRAAVTGRALRFAGAMTLGFVGAFALFGLALRPVAGPLQQRLPWLTVALGVGCVLLGGWLLLGRGLGVRALVARRAPRVDGSFPATVVLGVAFAGASLGCTVGPFLAIVVSSLRAGSLLEGGALFLAYALGMGAVVATAAVAVAQARSWLVRRMRAAAPYVSRAGGAVAVLSGAYVAYYGWYELRVLRGELQGDPVVEAAGRLQGVLADGLDRAGLGAVLAALAVLVVAGVGIGPARRAVQQRLDRHG
ncbi:cytochrome c biogenesis CcdA family protein [Motilibacter aurantiacus]|uniref:cytochrome c biogenesis CcdA family protein n=1 Tax=Motilibacter aurantiacus TaxID=2714955 RepID=UPI00140DA1B3|nr:cytochrome c biogenesis protein CcdA [Motilibacter aurantiacus]NHC46020.1 cytochrome c biogenesis protein CcdA [Motilibacter aurantiacus]